MYLQLLEWNDIVDMMETHIMKIRSSKQYQSCQIYAFIESNYSVIEAKNVSNVITQHQFMPIKVHYQVKANNMQRVGVYTGPNEKRMYVQELSLALSHESLYYPIDFEFISCKQTNVIKDELLQQLRMYRRETKMSVHEDEAFAQVHVAYSGKGGGRKDDLCMALQMAVYHGNEKLMSDEYDFDADTFGWKR